MERKFQIMKLKEAFKKINLLKRERSQSLVVFNYNVSQIDKLENKRVLTGRDTRELKERKQFKTKVANDIYFSELTIDKIISQFPFLQITGYTPRIQ